MCMREESKDISSAREKPAIARGVICRSIEKKICLVPCTRDMILRVYTVCIFYIYIYEYKFSGNERNFSFAGCKNMVHDDAFRVHSVERNPRIAPPWSYQKIRVLIYIYTPCIHLCMQYVYTGCPEYCLIP